MRSQRSGHRRLGRFSTRPNGDVDGLVRHIDQTVFHLQLNRQTSMQPGQLVQTGDQYVFRQQLAYADADYACNALATAANAVLKLAKFFQDSASMLQKDLTFLGQ